jgi:hypothetical protein
MCRRFLQYSAVPLIGVALLAGCYDSGSSSYSSSAPSLSFTAPSMAMSINLGQSLKLAWTSAYTSGCTASASSAVTGAFSGAVPSSGMQTVTPTATGTVSYTISCGSMGNMVTATSATITVNPNVLSTLTKMTTIGSTLDPVEMGGNPYGLAIAPVTSGLVSKGDLVACNFNDGATNTQGQGTTIVGLHPTAGATPYRIAQSAQVLGCSSLAMLADGSIAASVFNANTDALVSTNGSVGNPFGADPFQRPWGQTYVPANGANPAAIYVGNEGNGTIDRISLSGDTQTAFTEVVTGFCASGSPGAVYAPAGLTYDPSIDTLYIVDTSSYSVVALANVSSIGKDGVVVNGSCSSVTQTPTPALTFSGAAASQVRVIAHGGQFNAPISAALLANGDLVVGNGDIDGPTTTNLLFEISPALGFVGSPVQLDSGAPGALFGIVATTDASGNQLIYFNDDNSNTVNLLSK